MQCQGGKFYGLMTLDDCSSLCHHIKKLERSRRDAIKERSFRDHLACRLRCNPTQGTLRRTAGRRFAPKPLHKVRRASHRGRRLPQQSPTLANRGTHSHNYFWPPKISCTRRSLPHILMIECTQVPFGPTPYVGKAHWLAVFGRLEK